MDSITGFCLALLTVLIVPGPTNTLLATSGATVGLRKSLHLLLLELLGYATAIALIRTFIASVIERLPGETRFIRIVAAIYLLGLAVGLWRWRLASATRAVRAHHLFITTLLNPKALLIALVLLPPAASADFRYWVALALMIPSIGTGWIYLGSSVGKAAFHGLAATIPRAASVILGVFAALLILSVAR
jgi:threonine/homoserine/homoserine lactone efflux protein